MASGKKTLTVQQLEGLIPALQRRAYQVVGPVVREGAIVYDVVEKLADLPAGWTDEQAPGRYRLQRRNDQALFGYVVGPHSWKKYLHPAEIRLFAAERQDGTLRILNNAPPPPRRAFLGVRACELAAIAVQDRVLQGDRYRDPIYSARRKGIFIVAVNCTQAASTCFCTSMKTGPQVERGFDLALTELVGPEKHQFLIEAGSDAGAEVLAELESVPASPEICAEAKAAVEGAAAQIQRHMDTTNIRDLLSQNFDHPRWDNVAQRCLTCANCTMVCPTCFCTTVEDVSDLTGTHAERWRKWDSCFSQSFSYIHGGSVRSSTKSRYRQWMTHKLGSWIDQFGGSGCVGCGRCITWCPVGIDITEEVRAIREPAASPKENSHGNP
ncbi:Cytosolic bidirectional (NiFe)-hydrogenases (NADP coupled, Group 3b), iron-sulfur subunit [Candidatus Sulfotelmatobacter sp. SbA7]|nr:Cytosolic bidirectional (NiFe)-hydrogenases (NADP coupled, Group 3b), iron-sulfur subunit [Candidatus Sulfotelmatobacter sp. SbA7]